MNGDCIPANYLVTFVVPVTVYVHADDAEDAKTKSNQYRLALLDKNGIAKDDGWGSGFPQEVTATELVNG